MNKAQTIIDYAAGRGILAALDKHGIRFHAGRRSFPDGSTLVVTSVPDGLRLSLGHVSIPRHQAAGARSKSRPPKLIELAHQCAKIIAKADGAGVCIDDGNVVDLCADNLRGPASLDDIRSALVVAGFAARFPQATADFQPS